MRVRIDFDGSQVEFEQFCQTPQRMAHAQLLQQYQGWLQQPYQVEVEGSPAMPALPGGPAAGPAYYQTTPLALPAGAAPGWEPGGWSALPHSQDSSRRRWMSRFQLTGPVKFFRNCSTPSK